MKKYYLFILCSAIFTLSACNKEDEEKDYTYSIENVFWSDSLDSNQDGFAQFKRLHFNVHLVEDVSRTTVAEIYYRPKNASEFSFYAFSDFYKINGNSVDNDMLVDIGFPNKELKHGYYDFMIELYEKGNNRLEAKSDSLFEDILSNHAFDESARDKSYLLDVQWDNIDDRDQDGYARNAELNINIDILDDVTREVELKIYVKKADETEYTLYKSIDTISITGSSVNDAVVTEIGLNYDEFDYDAYDFRIELFEKGSNILVQFADEKLDELNDRKFEKQSEDSFNYFVKDVFWSDSTDIDSDGYTSRRRMNFDVDVDKDILRGLIAKVFVRHPDSTDYSIYDSISVFNINGSSSDDKISVIIGTANTQLDSSSYDFLVSVYETSLFDTIVAISFPTYTDTSLFVVEKFETESQDSL